MVAVDERPVAVIGLGNMGHGSAATMLKAGITVRGCDRSVDQRAKFEANGGEAFDSAADAAAGCRAAFIFVVNNAQAEAVLFGEGGIVGALPQGAVVVNCVTVPPAYAESAAERVIAAGLDYLDAPVSGGAIGASTGQMTIMASGAMESFGKVSDCFDAIAKRVYRMSDAPGDGSRMKVVNQLLAGVHIVSACEALTFGIKSGLDPKAIYDVISNSAGNSWMWGDRMPHVIDNDYTPKSAIDIFVKDLGIVLETGKQLQFPLPVAEAAHKMFLAASGAGFGAEDDSAVAKIYAANSNIQLPQGGGG